MVYDKLIPLGDGCNITLLLQSLNLKNETSLFEWFLSASFNDICRIILQLNNKSVNLSFFNKNVYMGDTKIHSAHYTLDEYRAIFKRRADRFVDILKNNKNVLFIRFNLIEKYTVSDIEKFVEAVKLINHNIDNMKLLIISNNEDFKINHPFVIQEFVNKEVEISIDSCADKNSKICTEVRKILDNLNFDTKQIYLKNFTDKD